MRDISPLAGREFDVVFSNHAVEHLYPHEVVPTLEGFRSVLAKGGVAIVIVPNLKGIQPTHDVVYTTPAGTEVCGMDMIFGHLKMLPHMPYMAHHTGFVKETMGQALRDAGFETVAVTEDSAFNLIAAGVA
jgi:trans-aconitate methyltransferase